MQLRQWDEGKADNKGASIFSSLYKLQIQSWKQVLWNEREGKGEWNHWENWEKNDLIDPCFANS